MNFKESVKRFRAKRIDIENAHWEYFSLLQIANLRDMANYYSNWTQFTGLLDSKGVEIYEGDIVQTTGFVFNDKEKTKKSEIDFISLIEFCPQKSCFVTVSQKYGGVHGLRRIFITTILKNEKSKNNGQ